MYRDKLKGPSRDDRLKWGINMDSWFPLFQTLAYFCDILSDICPHEWSVEALSGQPDYSVCPQVSHIFMQFLVHSLTVFLRQNYLIPKSRFMIENSIF